MNTMTKMAAGAVLGGSMLVAGGFGLANAAPEAPVLPDAPQPAAGELLNVGLTVNGQQVGTIPNVSVNTAQTLATSVCPSDDLSSKLPQLATKQIETVPVCASTTAGVSYTFTTSGPGTTIPGSTTPGSTTIAPAQSSGSSSIGATATSTAPAAPMMPAAEGR